MILLLLACVDMEKSLPVKDSVDLPFTCPQFSVPTSLGHVQYPEAKEISGISIDPLTDLIWAHNDSGDVARIFAFDETGSTQEEVYFVNAPVTDWEDMAIGPAHHSSQAFLYIGDIGDNNQERDFIAIIRTPVPVPGQETIEDFDVFYLKYPDGSHDAEGLIVHPQTAEIYILTKPSEGGTVLYRPTTPLVGSEPIDLEKIVEIDLTLFVDDGARLVTGAAFSPDGRTLAMRTYTDVYFFSNEGVLNPDLWYEGGFCEALSAAEPQGEAIAFSAEGMGYYTISEGEYPAVNRVSLQYP